MNESVMPEKGDRVRVVLEGEVTASEKTGFNLGNGMGWNTIRPGAEHFVSVEILPRPMPPLPTEPTPILATVRGVEDVLLIGPDLYGWWDSAVDVDGWRLHKSEHITAWRVWTPGGAARASSSGMTPSTARRPRW